ncbi:MAG: beta-ketoacyl-[acyl-carrier-protein] synthase family protein [Desulfuromonadales bacterium]|nr:beta-ketoacyl-[acyl-carrier-protein] synthase family protein [Desulfuromonadales bacterium]
MGTKAVVVAIDIITPYGLGCDACWDGLLSNRSALSTLSRFKTEAFMADCAGVIAGLEYHGETSLVMQMICRLFAACSSTIPADARLLLATTKGEIDFLEKSILSGNGDVAESSLDRLLEKVAECSGARGDGLVLSAACTSSSAAAAQAAAMIRAGHADCVLVVACDAVTEFVYAGFSSLMALDKNPARPFDKNRAGLSVGEAAGYLLIMSQERAQREGRTVLTELAGWGLSDDANHMTGPSRESDGMISAIGKALQSAGVSAQEIGFISAHGTGTPYNDAMEMRAFLAVFKKRLPVYSVKGGIGHTMGAAGLVELAMACRALHEKVIPPTVGLGEVADDARGWVSACTQSIPSPRHALVTNAGFSGVNTALVLSGRCP